MGLDMYLRKIKRLNRGMNTLYNGKVVDDEEISELGQEYSVFVEREFNERPVPAAVKAIGIPMIAKEKMYKPLDILKAYHPDVKEEDVVDFRSTVSENEDAYLLYYFVKEEEEPITITITEKEYEKFVKVIESPAWMVENSVEVCYWRKANQIREWFVQNLSEPVENCERSTVTKENLEKLMEDCKKVLANKDNAKEIMPTSEGFFFGGTNYDEYYYQDIKRTLENMLEIYENMDWENEALYYTEWW